MVKELIPYVDANYRTLPDRKNRAMAGLSAGSGATYNVGLNHTELISQFGLFSAGVLNTAAASQYPYLASAKAAEGKYDLMWISCGLLDTDLAGIKDFLAHHGQERHQVHLRHPRGRTCLGRMALVAGRIRAAAIPEELIGAMGARQTIPPFWRI